MKSIVECDQYRRKYKTYSRTAYCRMMREKNRLKFFRKHEKKIEHAMSHSRSFSFTLPIFTCQVELVELARKAIPYSKGTGTRDILYRLWRDWESRQHVTPRKRAMEER